MPTATIYVKVFPAGVPGRVLISVESGGPAGLSDAEVASVLRQAANSIESGELRRDDT